MVEYKSYVCSVCGKPFLNLMNAKYCSSDCRTEHRRERSKKYHDKQMVVARQCLENVFVCHHSYCKNTFCPLNKKWRDY